MPPKTKKELPHGAIVVLLDIGGNMTEKYHDGRQYHEVAKETADWIFSRKLFSSAAERMGVVSYGSETTLNEREFEGVQVHCEDLVVASFDHLRFINKECEVNEKNIGNVFHGLTVCMDLLKKHGEEHGADVDEFTIVLITNGMNENIRKADLELLEERMKEMSCDLIVIGIEQNGSYPGSALIELAQSLEGSCYDFQHMLKSVSNFVPKSKDTRNNNKQWEIAPGVRLPVAFSTKSGKAQSSLKFELVDEFGDKVVRVNQLVLQNEQGETQTFANVPKSALKAVESQVKKAAELNLDKLAETQAIKPNFDNEFEDDGMDFTVSVKKSMKEDLKPSAKELDKDELVTGQYFGKTLIFFDDEETKTQYNNHNFNEGETGGCLKLIQFTKKCNINPSYFLGDKCYTVLPAVKKSMNAVALNATRCTLTLIEAMLDLEVVAICRYAYHASSHLQLMALFAHRDEANGVAFLRAVRLPFIDDMRSLKFPKLEKVAEGGDQEMDTTPTLAHLSAIDDLIDLMQFDEQDTETFTNGGICDPEMQLHCHYLKNKVLKPEESNEANLQNAIDFVEKQLAPKLDVVEKNGEVFDRLAREFNLNRIEKVKRQRIELESIDMRQIIEEWQTRKDDESPKRKKAKESKTRKEELEDQFEAGPGLAAKEACDSSLKTIERMCLFPDNVTRREFFKILQAELEIIRDLCVFHLVYEEFNKCLLTIRDEEEYAPFCDLLGDEKKILPINSDDILNCSMTLEQAEDFWEETD